MKNIIMIGIVSIDLCCAAACAQQAPSNAVLRVTIPAAVDVTQVQVVSVAQPTADVWNVQLAYTTRQNLAGRIGVDVWVQSVAAISVTVTRAEIAALLGVPVADLPVTVAVGDRLGIPQAWVPALMKKATIAMSPAAAARYGH